MFSDETDGTPLTKKKNNRGELRSVYELPLAHYSKIEGVDVTWMKQAAEASARRICKQ